jgi:hypothetical protein
MGPRRWPRRVYDLDPTFKVKLNGPRMRQWRTASLKLVKDARLEEHLGKPTWAAEVRRWAKEFDREAVLSAESNQHHVESRGRRSNVDYQVADRPRASLSLVARAVGAAFSPCPFPVLLRKRDGASQLAVRLLCGTHSLRSMAHIGGEDKDCPRCGQTESVMHFLTAHCGLAMKMFEEVVGERCFCGCGRGLTPRCLEWFRALEQEDKLLLVLGGPLPSPSPSCFSDPEVGNAAMAILAELWAARNEALTAKMAKLVPGPARGTLLAYFPREQAVVAAPQLESEAPPVAPRRLLESRAGKAEWGEFVPLAPVEGKVRGVDEWRQHFRGEVRAAAAPRAAPHAPAPPAALLPPTCVPAGFAGLLLSLIHI